MKDIASKTPEQRMIMALHFFKVKLQAGTITRLPGDIKSVARTFSVSANELRKQLRERQS